MRPSWPPLLQRFHVLAFVIGDAVFPTTIDDPDPSVGEGTDGGIMRFPLSLFLIVIATGPATIENRLCGKFVKALLHEVGAGKAAMYPHFLPAALGHGRNAGILGDF